MKCNLNLKPVEQFMLQVGETVAKQTAADIKSKAERSIKQTRKLSKAEQKRGKKYVGSKPGKPPLSPSGRLKHAIRYETTGDGSFVIGPEQYGSQPLWNTLEHGGSTQYDRKTVRPQNRRNFTERKTGKPAPVKKGRSPRPAQRPVGKRGIPYKYFWSVESRENAIAATGGGFLAWCGRQTPKVERISTSIAPRPYMEPAFKAETKPERIAKRIARATKGILRKGQTR